MATLLTFGLALLAGCSGGAIEPREENAVTWQEAKADAQTMERYIAALIPTGDVLNVDQHETGTLFSCDDVQHRWLGRTTVALAPGVDAESVVRRMELAFAGDDRFIVTSRTNLEEHYLVKLKSPSPPAQTYIFGESAPGEIAIDSWSVCFTLPEGVYPGGKF
jgi:hypothetical protein